MGQRSIRIHGTVTGSAVLTGDHGVVTITNATAPAAVTQPTPKGAEKADRIGRTLARAVDYSTKTNRFFEQLAQLKPRVVAIAGWLFRHGRKVMAAALSLWR